jgi:diaminopimelate epimerase
MNIQFSKYQGTGNDFIVIDDRKKKFPKNESDLVMFLCDRRFGIGGDGLMLLQESDTFDFKMVYFNSDGKESTMCGNGGRCIAAFAKKSGIFHDKCAFEAIDGEHQVTIETDEQVNLKMTDVKKIETDNANYFLDTGSPHYVVPVDSLDNYDVISEGRKIRYNARFKALGTNVNFYQQKGNGLVSVRTYERGVENETYSCGTGAVASAISAALVNTTDNSSVDIQTKGGNLQVKFTRNVDNTFSNIWLKGPATFVFSGQIEV